MTHLNQIYFARLMAFQVMFSLQIPPITYTFSSLSLLLKKRTYVFGLICGLMDHVYVGYCRLIYWWKEVRLMAVQNPLDLSFSNLV